MSVFMNHYTATQTGHGQLMPNGLTPYCKDVVRSARLRRSRSCRSTSELNGFSDHYGDSPSDTILATEDTLPEGHSGYVKKILAERNSPASYYSGTSVSGDAVDGDVGDKTSSRGSRIHAVSTSGIKWQDNVRNRDQNTFVQNSESISEEAKLGRRMSWSSDINGCVPQTHSAPSKRRVTFKENVTNIEALLRMTERRQAKQQKLQKKVSELFSVKTDCSGSLEDLRHQNAVPISVSSVGMDQSLQPVMSIQDTRSENAVDGEWIDPDDKCTDPDGESVIRIKDPLKMDVRYNVTRTVRGVDSKVNSSNRRSSLRGGDQSAPSGGNKCIDGNNTVVQIHSPGPIPNVTTGQPSRYLAARRFVITRSVQRIPRQYASRRERNHDQSTVCHQTHGRNAKTDLDTCRSDDMIPADADVNYRNENASSGLKGGSRQLLDVMELCESPGVRRRGSRCQTEQRHCANITQSNGLEPAKQDNRNSEPANQDNSEPDEQDNGNSKPVKQDKRTSEPIEQCTSSIGPAGHYRGPTALVQRSATDCLRSRRACGPCDAAGVQGRARCANSQSLGTQEQPNPSGTSSSVYVISRQPVNHNTDHWLAHCSPATECGLKQDSSSPAECDHSSSHSGGSLASWHRDVAECASALRHDQEAAAGRLSTPPGGSNADCRIEDAAAEPSEIAEAAVTSAAVPVRRDRIESPGTRDVCLEDSSEFGRAPGSERGIPDWRRRRRRAVQDSACVSLISHHSPNGLDSYDCHAKNPPSRTVVPDACRPQVPGSWIMPAPARLRGPEKEAAPSGSAGGQTKADPPHKASIFQDLDVRSASAVTTDFGLLDSSGLLLDDSLLTPAVKSVNRPGRDTQSRKISKESSSSSLSGQDAADTYRGDMYDNVDGKMCDNQVPGGTMCDNVPPSSAANGCPSSLSLVSRTGSCQTGVKNATCPPRDLRADVKPLSKPVVVQPDHRSKVKGQMSSDLGQTNASGSCDDTSQAEPLIGQDQQSGVNQKPVSRCRQKIQRRNAFRRSKSTSDARTADTDVRRAGRGRLSTSKSLSDVTELSRLVGEASIGLSASRSTEALQSAAEHVYASCRRQTAVYKQLRGSGDDDEEQAKKRFYVSCPDLSKVTGWIAHMFKTRSRDTSLKLLVVPKDEDILQMAYQSSAYRQGKEPYKGSATDIPEPPELNVDSGVYQPTRYKSEIHIQTFDGSSHGTGQKLSGFDPRVPRQRLSTSSIGSVSSGSSYSTSKDVGAAHSQMANTDGVENNSQEVTRAAVCSSRAGHAPVAQCVASSAAESSSANHHNNSHVPPVAPARSSSKNITFINFQQPSLMQHQGHSDFVHCSNQMAAPYTHPSGSMENLERSSDSSSSKASDSSKSSDMSEPMVRTEPPPSVEKLLRTGYETKYQRPVCDGLRRSSDSLTTPRDQPATSQPRASTTITLTTSTMLPPSGRHPGSQWRSDSQVYKIDRTSPSAVRQSSGMVSSTTDVSASVGYQYQRNGHAQLSSRPDSYGLTVSLQIDPRHRNYADHEPKAPRRNSERNSVPEHHMINMVSERLKKFESADNVDSGVAVWRQRKPNCYQPGYDSVLSRAAEFESRHEDDDDRTRRKRSTMHNSPFSTPASSTSSLPQVLPPPEINKVPATPPATINFYFREGLSHAQTGSVNIEPSPERLPADASDSFRMRVSSEPPGGAVREGRSQDRGHMQTAATTGYSSVSSPVSKRRPATRQPSYLAAVSPAQEGTSSSSETTLATTTAATSTTTPVTFRERSRSEDREARLVRRTSYLLATGRQRSSGYQDPNRVDVSRLVLPPPPSNANTQGDDDSKLSRTKLQLPTSSGSGSLGQCKEVSEPSTESPDSRSPPPPLTPTTTAQSPNPDTVTTPTKTSNIKKLKLLFGEKTPRILEGLSERRTYFDMPSPAGGVKLEGPLLCKIAITDGKRASDRSWKPCYAQLRGQALFLFKDKNNASPTPFEDQPISVRSSIVDIAYDYTKKKNVFRLTTYNGSEYLFQADDHDTMLQWIRMIQENSNPEEDKKAEATIEQTTRKGVQQQESATVNKNSPQVALKGKEKKTSTRSLRSKSPSSHSPGSKPRKQFSEKDLMDPSSQKPKDTKTWKDRMAKKFKRYGSSSSASADLPETSESSEITGTFGVPLEACPCSSFSEYVPLVVEVCTKIVEERGLEYQGIYRVPGNTGAVNTLQEELNRAVDYESLELESEKWMDVNVVSSLLKSFFRKLPEPLITEDLYQAMIAANRIPNQEKRMLKIKKLLHDLPEHNFETFRYIAEHLNKVSEKGDLNKMDGRNLAIVFGPTLIRTSDENMVTMVTDMSDQCRIVESIIANYKWFFSSWFEDVNVPVEEQTDTVPVSGMNQELITKAENLGDRGRDVSVKELMSSVLQAANRKIRKKDKPKTSDSVDIDIESEPNSYNERNIDKEIELRKGKEASQNCLTKESSINLEQLASSTCAATSTTTCTAVQESKNSLGPETGSARESTQSGIDAKMSASTSSSSAGQSSSHGQDKEHGSSPTESSGGSDRQQAGLPIKRYPAYPKPDVSAPQTENSKPALLKKYSCEELARVDWPRADEPDHGGEPRREHDEVRKTYGLTAQTRQHLRRIEQETEALRRREQERRKDQERAALARQRIELELQKTRRELEEEHNLDELLSQGTGASGKLAGYRQKYSNHVNSTAADNHSVTSDYSTMSSTNTTQGSCQQERQPPDAGTASRHRSGEPYGCQKPNGRPRPGAGPIARNTYGPLVTSLHSDRAMSQQDADDVHKIRKGSLDSLLDVYDRDLAHIDSDEEADHVRKDEERLLASSTAVEPRLQTAPELAANQQQLGKDSHHNSRDPSSSSGASSNKRSYGNPSWYKAPRSDGKLVGVASRFERVKSAEARSNDANPPCFKADNCPVGKLSSVPSASRAPPQDTDQSAAESGREGATSDTWSSQSGRSRQVPDCLYKQDSSEQSTDEYISALRKSTEKLFGSGEDLIDLRSPTTETGNRAGSPPTWDAPRDKAGRQTAAPARRRRHTVGGPDELENRKAMMTATHEYLNRRTVDRRSAWERLQPKTAVADDVQDIKSWCMHQRLRHVGSSPALFEPRLVTVGADTDSRPTSCAPVSSQSTVGDHPSTFSFLSSI